jgi:hypothetical protein
MALDPNDPALEPGGAEPSRQETFSRGYVEELRRESAGHRTKNKELEARATAAEQKAGSADAEIKNLRLSVALTEEAMTMGIKPSQAKFYLHEAGQWDDLDPAGKDFRQTLHDRLDSLRAENPELKAGRSTLPTRSGTGGPTGGPGAGPSSQLTRSQVANMKPEAVEEALKRGDLNQLLGRR